jgi:hypothetical protein
VNIALYVIAGWLTLGALLTIGFIGKPRKPTTPGTAAVVVMINAALIVTLVLAARRLA